MANLLKWKVDSAPSGPYRSFQTRSWPHAAYAKSGQVAARLECKDENGVTVEYRPANVREGKHPEITVFIAQHFHTAEERAVKGGFTYRRLKGRPKTLGEAKALAESACAAHPDFQPKEETDGQPADS